MKKYLILNCIIILILCILTCCKTPNYTGYSKRDQKRNGPLREKDSTKEYKKVQKGLKKFE